FSLVVFPFRFQVLPQAPAPVVQERIGTFCTGEGLACLDLLPPMKKMGESAFLDYDHLNPAGARLVAEAIATSSLMPSVAPLSNRLPPGAAVKDADPAVRRGAAWALGRQPAANGAVPALAAVLADTDEAVRHEAARALGAMGESARSAVPSLFDALCDERASVRWTAALS